jgi:dTDP-4-amino-4,6-dideoxygalactose transaminase
MIPFMDLSRQYAGLKTDILARIAEVCESRDFILGRWTERFETAFAAWIGIKHCAGCSNGTSALSLALEAAGIRSGDEVVTTPFTFFATAEAVCNVGAKPVFADIDHRTFNISPDRIRERITPRTRAIVPVHLYGSPADMDAINAIARENNLVVIEDCAQSHGALLNGKMTGRFGRAGSFSFFPGKNLGAFGDAGAVVSDDPAFDDAIRKLRNHGRAPKEKYLHETIGRNDRIDGLQSAILEVKLGHLTGWVSRRREIAALYDRLLADVPRPEVLKGAQSAYHLYVVRTADRDQVQKRLKEKGFETGVHYPVPLHLQPAFAYLGYKKGDFPVSERAADSVLSIPLFPEMTDDEVRASAEAVRSTIVPLRGSDV